MKSNVALLSEPAPMRKRRLARRAAAATVVALLGLTACTSDPGPKRVAQDIIKAETYERQTQIDVGVDLPPIDEECLLTKLDTFSSDDLKAINDNLDAENSDRNADGEKALTAYELVLSECV